MKKYGQVIAKLRKNKGLTQEQLGKMLNVSYQAVSKWENDLAEPSLDTIEKLTQVFGITMTDFFNLANGVYDTNSQPNKTSVIAKGNFLQTKPWYLVAGLVVLAVILLLCVILIPATYSSKQIFNTYNNSVFYISAQGPSISQTGTGFFINNSGLAVSLYSNIQNCTSGTIELSDGTKYNIEKIIGIDKENNLAIFQTGVQRTKPIKMANSNHVEMGEKVYAITYTDEDDYTSVVTEGMVFKVESDSNGVTSFQTTASIDNANRGGVLFNEKGEAIGIISGYLSVSGVGFDMVNICKPINRINDVEHDYDISMQEFFDNSLKVSVYDEDTSLLGVIEVYKGDLLENFNQTGYIFDGYYLDANFINKFDSSEPIMTSMSLFAKLTPISYTVSFNANGGFGSMSDQVFTYDTGANLNECAFRKVGYMFKYWRYDDNHYYDGERVYNLTSEQGAQVVLTAEWEILKYRVVFDGNGATNTKMPDMTITYNQTALLISNTYVREGYQFIGWAYNNKVYSDGQQVCNLTETESIVTLYAIWEVIDYDVQYVLDGGTNDTNNITTYNILSTSFVLKEPSKQGFDFVGWYQDALFTEAITEISPTMCKDLILYAKFSAIKYKINYNMNGGSTSLKDTDKYYTIVEEHIISVKPGRAYYDFIGWFDNAELEGEPVTRIPLGSMGEVQLYAKYTPINYTITYDLNGGTLAVENVTTYNIETPTFALNSPEKPGCTFIGWRDGRDYLITQIYRGSVGDKTLVAEYDILEADGVVVLTSPEAFIELVNERDYWSRDIVVENDIDMEGYPISQSIGIDNHSVGYDFTGNFDGKNHTISNLSTAPRLTAYSSGIFGRTSGSTIKNITFTNVNLTFIKSADVGSLIGYSANTTVDNCHVQGVLNIKNYEMFSHYMAGLVGYGGTISNSSVDLTINLSTYAISYTERPSVDLAGFAGFGAGVTNCHAKTILNVDLSSDSYVPTLSESFISGFAGYGCAVKNCYSESEINIDVEVDITQIAVVAFSYYSNVENSFAICSTNVEFFRDLNDPNITYYTFGKFNDSQKITNCYYSDQNTVTGLRYQGTNGTEADLQTIREFCLANWDEEIWDMSTDRNPILRSAQ